MSINNAAELTYLKGKLDLHMVEQITKIIKMLSVFLYFHIQVCCFVCMYFLSSLGISTSTLKPISKNLSNIMLFHPFKIHLVMETKKVNVQKMG